MKLKNAQIFNMEIKKKLIEILFIELWEVVAKYYFYKIYSIPVRGR